MNKKIMLFSVFAIANSRDDLQSELDNFINDLNQEGYGWLVNYSNQMPDDKNLKGGYSLIMNNYSL